MGPPPSPWQGLLNWGTCLVFPETNWMNDFANVACKRWYLIYTKLYCSQTLFVGNNLFYVQCIPLFQFLSKSHRHCYRIHRVSFIGMIHIRISNPQSLGSWHIKGTNESTLPWSEWSQINDPDLHHPKRMHPQSTLFKRFLWHWIHARIKKLLFYKCCWLAFVTRCLHFTPQVKDKISESDRDMIVEKCKEALSWLEENPEASKDEYERKQKELEGVCNPVITKLYQGAGGGAPPPPGAGGFSQGGGADSSQSGGPTIEEVD